MPPEHENGSPNMHSISFRRSCLNDALPIFLRRSMPIRMGFYHRIKIRPSDGNPSKRQMGSTFPFCTGPTSHPTKDPLPNKILFGIGRDLIVNIPINWRGTVDIYINHFMCLTVDIKGSDNATRLERGPLLGLSAIAWEVPDDKPISCGNMDAISKLVAEMGLTKQKIILGWYVDFRWMTIGLPENKCLAHLKEAISEMLQRGLRFKGYWYAINQIQFGQCVRIILLFWMKTILQRQSCLVCFCSALGTFGYSQDCMAQKWVAAVGSPIACPRSMDLEEKIRFRIQTSSAFCYPPLDHPFYTSLVASVEVGQHYFQSPF